MSEHRQSLLTVPLLLLAVVVLTVIGTPTLAAMPVPEPPPVGEGGAGNPPAGIDPAVAIDSPAGSRVLFPVPEDARYGYYVQVGLVRQRVHVYLDGLLIRSMVCSTGVVEDDHATPIGRFYIQNRGESFFSEKYQQGALWWVSFRDWGIYLFHSVPTDRDGNVIPEEAAKLGIPASHGCVRLTLDDARWFYATIPQGTPVDIQ